MSRPLWAARRARAAHLLREAPHAEGILAFYVRLIEVQERIAERVPADDWLKIASSDGESPSLHSERIPPEELSPLFDDFLDEMIRVGTDIIATESRVLREAGPAPRLALLSEPAGFHARAFLEPVLTTLAAADHRSDGHGSTCFRCGSLPVVGILHDLPDALGARSLVCSLCATEWRTDRLKCAHCGETSADSLLAHTAESVPWVRISECLTCKRYMKTVDLRQRGDAVPVVDELAAVELDLWAQERGLLKLQPNVLEL